MQQQSDASDGVRQKLEPHGAVTATAAGWQRDPVTRVSSTQSLSFFICPFISFFLYFKREKKKKEKKKERKCYSGEEEGQRKNGGAG